MKDFYYILNVDANSSLNEIREAYKILAEKFQPFLDQHDKFVDEQFREICDAYQVLSDPDSRRNYDQGLAGTNVISLKKASKVKKGVFKTRTIDVIFTIVLGLFTSVFGYYVISSIRSFKKTAKPKKALVVSLVSHPKTYRTKYKHRINVSAKSPTPEIGVADTPAVLPSQKAPAFQPQIYADKNSIGSQTIADISQKEARAAGNIPSIEKVPASEASLPYTTYLKSNETGLINMRKFDNYVSEIIKVIPTNSPISVLEKGTVYYKVLYDNTTGYVPKWNILKK